jgi:hypothetical protein
MSQVIIDRFAEMMPEDLEAKAARAFEAATFDAATKLTGHLYKWDEASLHTKNRWRLKVLIEDRNQWRKKT